MDFARQPRRNDRPALVGMVHLLPLPGSPGWAGSMQDVLDAAQRDAERLAEGGCDALLVENMADLPYLRGEVYPETAAAMAVATYTLATLGLPLGVQVLAGANRQALGVCVASGASFLRAEAFAYGHVADEGWLQATAGPLLRARAALGSEVAVWADVQKKHAAHAVTADVPLADLARGFAFSGADALIITGSETGASARPGDVQTARAAELPVIVGSGITADNAADFADADALIVGSWLKEAGDWRNPVSVERVRQLRRAIG